MKQKIITILTFLIAALNLHAQQAPENFEYQSIIRNLQGEPLANQQVIVKFTILKDLSNVAVYSESHSTTTDSIGFLFLKIGQGTPELPQYSFATIDWLSGTHFLKTEISTNGGTSYDFETTQQFLSVPYAFVANKAYTSVAWENAVPHFENTLNTLDSLLNIYDTNMVIMDSLIRQMEQSATANNAHSNTQTISIQQLDNQKDACLKKQK